MARKYTYEELIGMLRVSEVYSYAYTQRVRALERYCPASVVVTAKAAFDEATEQTKVITQARKARARVAEDDDESMA